MKRHYSLITADKILKELFKFTGRKEDRISVEAWSNGREQGYFIQNYNNMKACCFAQQRNSDNIVIYHGTTLDFDISTHQPKNWNQFLELKYNEYKQAALDIHNHIK